MGYFGSRIYWEEDKAENRFLLSNFELVLLNLNCSNVSILSQNGGGRWVLLSPPDVGEGRGGGRGRRMVAYHNQSSDYPLGKKLWYFLNNSVCGEASPSPSNRGSSSASVIVDDDDVEGGEGFGGGGVRSLFPGPTRWSTAAASRYAQTVRSDNN